MSDQKDKRKSIGSMLPLYSDLTVRWIGVSLWLILFGYFYPATAFCQADFIQWSDPRSHSI